VSHDKFSLLINDNCSGFGFVFNMCHKDETTRAIIELDKVIEMKFQKRVHTLWTDNGGEFVNQQLQTYCQNHGISLVTSVAYNPELNGRAERQNQTHIEGARTMLKDLQLGKDLWGEAISTHIYIRNRCPSSILPNNITPYKKILGQPPSVDHLQVFGSKCLIKVPDENWSKLNDKALECRLISFEGDSIYIVVNSDKKRLRSHNVIFMEEKANRGVKDEPAITFPMSKPTIVNQEPAHSGSAYIEKVSDSMSDEPKKQHTKLEVWGTDPTRWSEHLSNQGVSEKILVMKAVSNPKIRIPKAYTDAFNSP